MRKLYVSILFAVSFLCFNRAISQLNYSFSASAGTYTPITGTSPVLTSFGVTDAAAPDEGFANAIPIGFSFNYNGTNYTTVNINTNGFFSLGTPFEAPGNGYYLNDLANRPNSPTAYSAVRPIIAPLWDDLDMASANNISYNVTGTAPNRVFTVQYANARWDWSAAGPVISFQIKLFETTNVIQFIYRQESSTVANGSGGASIGITAAGTGGGSFLSLNDASSSPVVSSAVSTNSILTKPATGQVYTFTPVSCPAPITLQTSNVTAGTATFSWAAAAGASGYEYAVSNSATAPASGTATTATSVSVNLAGGSANYLYLRTNCGGSFSVWSRVAIVPCTNNSAPTAGATNVSVPPTIAWNTVPGATGYSVMLSADGTSFINIGTVPASVTSVPINGLQYSTTYHFYIRAVAGGDTASTTCQSNATSFTTRAVPAAPSCAQLIVPANGAAAIAAPEATFTWRSVPSASGYIVLFGTSAASLDTLGATMDTTIQLSPLAYSTTYYWKIVPFNDGGEAAGCPVNSFTTQAPPPPPPCAQIVAPAANATNVGAPATTFRWRSMPAATSYIFLAGTSAAALDTIDIYTDTTAVLSPFAFSTTYYWSVIPVNGLVPATGCPVYSFTTQVAPPKPANDSCGAAIAITPFSGVVNGTTVSATPSPAAPICPPSGNDPAGTPDDDVWYSIRPTQSGSATVTVTGDQFFDAVVSVYSGTCGALSLVSCIDTTLEGGTEVLTLNNLTAGQTYFIRVYDWYEDNFATFRISVSGAALPVTITKFEGRREAARNVLSWTTQTEQNNKGFELQRSVDGKSFSGIGFVPSKANGGNSSALLQYTFGDAQPFSGSNYYRLKQIDKDEKINYSSVVLLKGNTPAAIQLSTVYPNPALSVLNLVVTSPGSTRVNFVVTDLAGKVVMQKASALDAGDNNITLNVMKLAPGSYIIKALCANGCDSALKFVKQ